MWEWDVLNVSGKDERPLHLYEPDEVSSEEGLVYDSDGNLLGEQVIEARRRRRGRRRKFGDLIIGVVGLITFFLINFLLRSGSPWGSISFDIAVVAAFCYGMYGLWHLYRFIFGIPWRGYRYRRFRRG